MTYNQRDFISQCLQSLVDQVANFPFEIIVSDDCSTDGTSEIVASFAARFPSLLRHVRLEQNIGPFRNFTLVHGLASGTYIAHVDGDDYALPGKLQTQADFLDRNPWCQIAWHKMFLQQSLDGQLVEQIYDEQTLAGMRFDVNDAIRNVTLGLHSSKMYRRWHRVVVRDIDAIDFSENVLHLHQTKGYAAFVAAPPLGVYRVGNGISKNAWRIRERIYRWMAYFYAHGLGDKRLICAKMLWMLLSDIKHNSASLRYGVRVVLPMLASMSVSQLIECRMQRLHLS